jgi:hypothetical protein
MLFSLNILVKRIILGSKWEINKFSIEKLQRLEHLLLVRRYENFPLKLKLFVSAHLPSHIKIVYW